MGAGRRTVFGGPEENSRPEPVRPRRDRRSDATLRIHPDDPADVQHPAPARKLPTMADADPNPPRQPNTSDDAAESDRWREALTQLGSEIAGPLTSALERVHALATSGRIERQNLRALREELEFVRQAGMTGQQLARLGSGRLRQAHERLNLTQTLQGMLTHRSREIHARGLRLDQSLRPAEVIADASLLFALITALLEWSMVHAGSSLEFRLERRAWPVQAQLTCRFPWDPPDPLAAVDDGDTPGPFDTLAWRLVEQIALCMGLPIEREEGPDGLSARIDFPRTVNDPIEGATAVELDEGFTPSTNSKPLAGSQVLVISARREVRNAVREAIRHMGLMIDFVHTVAQAEEFCSDGLPHAVVYESAVAGDRFSALRDSLLADAPDLAFIEITEDATGFEMSGFGNQFAARVGRESVHASLPSALMFELSRAI